MKNVDKEAPTQLTFEWAIWAVGTPPPAMAALRRRGFVIINTRARDIGRRGCFARSGDNGRVHDEDVFSLRAVVVVALGVWMKEKASRSRSSFYMKNGALGGSPCGGVQVPEWFLWFRSNR